jgi:hypothetical protein
LRFFDGETGKQTGSPQAKEPGLFLRKQKRKPIKGTFTGGPIWARRVVKWSGKKSGRHFFGGAPP